jgi:hypothetical protein
MYCDHSECGCVKGREEGNLQKLRTALADRCRGGICDARKISNSLRNNSHFWSCDNTGRAIFAPHILWEDHHVDVTASGAMAATKSPSARDEAKNFLADILANGPVPMTEIEMPLMVMVSRGRNANWASWP